MNASSGRRVAVLALVTATGLVGPSVASACSSCGCGDPTLTGMGLEKPYRNRVRLALEERFGGHTSGGGASEEQSFTLRSSLVVAWSPVAWLTINALVPVVSEWLRVANGPLQNVAGLGDVELGARAAVYRDREFSPRHIVSLTAGAKLPTGPRRYDGAGYPFPEDDQPGSGSWDPLFGASYAWFHDKLSVYASASYRLTTHGRRDYLHGQSVGATAALQYQPWRRAGFIVAADVAWAAADTLPGGQTMPNTGGTMLALSPAVVVAPLANSSAWLIKLGAQLHVADWLNGTQREFDSVILSTVVDVN